MCKNIWLTVTAVLLDQKLVLIRNSLGMILIMTYVLKGKLYKTTVSHAVQCSEALRTYYGVVAGAVVGSRVDEVVLNANICSGEIPAPCNRLDDLQIAKEAVRYVERGQLWAQNLQDVCHYTFSSALRDI